MKANFLDPIVYSSIGIYNSYIIQQYWDLSKLSHYPRSMEIYH